jgi:hypothetical protein
MKASADAARLLATAWLLRVNRSWSGTMTYPDGFIRYHYSVPNRLI